MIERLTFPSPAGDATPGVLATPGVTPRPATAHGAETPPLGASGTARVPAVIVEHEFFGLTPQHERMVERFADEGFLALAPDHYRGVTTRDPAEAARLAEELDGARSYADLRGALTFLREHPRSNGKVAIVGFSLGGAYAFGAACFVRGLACAVPFYGVPPRPDWSLVDIPIQAHFAARDTRARPERAEQIQQTLAARGVRMDLHIYDADHAFMNEDYPNLYSPEDARVAWERMIDFLRTHTAA